MSATTTPDSPAPFSSVTAAKTTPTVNAAISAARDLPDLVNKLQAVDPGLASQLEGTSLIAAKSPAGTLIGLALGWAIPHYGLACTAVVVTNCWTQNSIDVASGIGAIVGTAIAAYIMRYLTTSPIAGLFSKAATPVEQVLVAQKTPNVMQSPAPAPQPIPATTAGTP